VYVAERLVVAFIKGVGSVPSGADTSKSVKRDEARLGDAVAPLFDVLDATLRVASVRR